MHKWRLERYKLDLAERSNFPKFCFLAFVAVTRILALEETDRQTDRPIDQNISYLHSHIGLEYYMGRPVPD